VKGKDRNGGMIIKGDVDLEIIFDMLLKEVKDGKKFKRELEQELADAVDCRAKSIHVSHSEFMFLYLKLCIRNAMFVENEYCYLKSSANHSASGSTVSRMQRLQKWTGHQKTFLSLASVYTRALADTAAALQMSPKLCGSSNRTTMIHIYAPERLAPKWFH
jgi:hypothetical protein